MHQAMSVSEKRTLYNADDLLNIREIRNQTAHDYVTENINGFYLEVLNYVTLLVQIVENVKTFYKKKFY